MQWLNACGVLALLVMVCIVEEGSCFPGAPHCSPASIDDDPRTARFCSALSTFLELYAEAGRLDDKPQSPSRSDYQALLREYPNLLDPNMKRQDVVHNFLRFGRRRR